MRGRFYDYRDWLVELMSEAHLPLVFSPDTKKLRFDTAGNKVQKVLLFPVDTIFNNFVPRLRGVGEKSEQFFRCTTKRSLVNFSRDL